MVIESYSQTDLWNADSVNSVSQLLSDEQAEDLEGRLEPQRCRHYQHFLEFGRVPALQQTTIVKVHFSRITYPNCSNDMSILEVII